MERFRQLFKGVEGPRTSNATRHDFYEMLMIAVFSSLRGGQTCVDMTDCVDCNGAFLRQFMRLEHGTPSHNAFSRPIPLIERPLREWACCTYFVSSTPSIPTSRSQILKRAFEFTTKGSLSHADSHEQAQQQAQAA